MRPTIVNVYLIDCGGGQWVLVDTGMNTPDSVATLKDAFAQAGTELENLHGSARHPSSRRPFRRLGNDQEG